MVLLETRKPPGFSYTAYLCLQALAIGWRDSSRLGAPGARLIPKGWRGRIGATSVPNLPAAILFPEGGLLNGLTPEFMLEKTRETDLCPSNLPWAAGFMYQQQ